MDNNLLIEALKGLSVDRPPVWMMRQAGRYLPDFMKLKEKYDFFTRCRTPELVTEITLMPINQIGVDAAIIFSDILVVLQAMNIEVEMREGIGPFLPNPIKDKESLNQVILPDVHEHLGYVFDAVKLTKKELNNRVPLIGFAGAPWTLFCYALQGQGSKNFNTAKAFCYQHPELAKELLQKITTTTIAYLREKVKAGADVIQIFDSWAGLIKPGDFNEYCIVPNSKIVDFCKKRKIPVICFPKGIGEKFKDFNNIVKPDGINLDYEIEPSWAKKNLKNVVIQGGLDPKILLRSEEEIIINAKKYLDVFNKLPYVFNLGHGLLPETDPDKVKKLIKFYREY